MDRCRIISEKDEIKIKIYGRDLEELFINGAYGLSKVLYEDVDKTSKFIRGADKIKLKSKDKESLFLDFLNKVLSLSNDENKLYPKAKILKISPTNLVTQISGVDLEELNREVTSVNFYEEGIKEKNKKLEAPIVLS